MPSAHLFCSASSISIVPAFLSSRRTAPCPPICAVPPRRSARRADTTRSTPLNSIGHFGRGQIHFSLSPSPNAPGSSHLRLMSWKTARSCSARGSTLVTQKVAGRSSTDAQELSPGLVLKPPSVLRGNWELSHSRNRRSFSMTSYHSRPYPEIYGVKSLS